MKKILTAMAALAMVAGFASCQKENDSVNGSAENGFNKVTVKVSIPEASKVTYSEKENVLTPAWEENDKILVINNDNSASMLEVTEINGSVATLEGEAKNGLAHLVYMEGVNTSSWVSNKIEFSYDNQSGDNDMPAVMLADGTISNGCGEFMFNNAGAVIGIYNAKGVPANSAISKVTVTGSNLSKATISINDNVLKLTATEKADDAISTATLSNITVTDGTTGALSTPIFIAVPAGAKVAKVTLAVGTDTYSYTLAAAKEGKANGYLYIKTSAFKKDLPAGALPGVFSVSATKKVHFSQGNLIATVDASGAPTAWKFAENQYDCLGGSTSNTNAKNGDVDLFCWSTDAAGNNWGIGVYEKVAISGNFKDWGIAFCEANNVTPTNTWRTLSNAESSYLFDTRKVNGEKGYKYEVTFNEIKGIVLYPDDYTGDMTTSSFTKDTFPEDAVFFPYAGIYSSTSSISHYNARAYYWLSTPNPGNTTQAGCMDKANSFTSNTFSPRKNRFSVRLVTECK